MTAEQVRTRATRRGLLVDLSRRSAVLVLTAAVPAVAALPDPARPVLVLAGATVAAGAVAAVTGRRWAGTTALLAATLTVLLASALDASDLRPVQVLASAALLMALVSALAAVEERRASSALAVTVARARWPRLVAPALLALVAGSVVAVTAARDVVPSVPLVLAGLAATVTALAIAAGGHRS